MSIRVVKQYSVFLANQPGALKDFADLFVQENATLLAVSSDVRFDAAVVRVAIDYKQEVGHALTKAGFTNVKTDAICIDTPDRIGIARDIGAVMSQHNLNITSIYGAAAVGNQARFVLVVSDIQKAVKALEESGLF